MQIFFEVKIVITMTDSVTTPRQAVLRLPFAQREFTVYGGPEDESIMKTLVIGHGHYEVDTMRMLAKLVKHDSICLDIGANLGVMALALSALVPHGRVFAFEALPQIFNYLQQNVTGNGASNISPLNLAVYDKSGLLTVDYVAEFAGGSHTSETGIHDPRAQRTEVPCIRLDDWFSQQKLSRLDFVKMDIEGAEVRALAGAAQVLRQYKPHLIIECNSHALQLLQGSDPSHLWASLHDIYPHIYLLKGNNRIVRLNSRSSFDEHLQWQKGTVVQNLLCSFKRWSSVWQRLW
jgi:FkbM family methyltransferase